MIKKKVVTLWIFASILMGFLVLPVGGGNYVQETVNWYVPETYNISGYVKNATGSAINSVSVTNNLTATSNTTNASGYCILHDLCNRTYLITATKAGYNTNSTVATISGADLTNTNITLTEIVGAPNITSWWNNYTADNSTNFTIPYEDEDNRTVFFNVTADDPIDYWVWYVDGALYQNSSSDNITKTWDEGGNKTVSVYGLNANGQTNTLTWDIEIEHTQHEYAKLIYEQNLLLLEEEKMIGQTMLFLVFMGTMFGLMGYSFIDRHNPYYANIFAAVFATIIAFLLANYSITEAAISRPELSYFFLSLGIVMVFATVWFVVDALQDFFPFTEERKREKEKKDRNTMDKQIYGERY